MKDKLGNRIKEQYEDRTRYLLPRRTYSILRLDGKAFHTYTRGLKRPFDGDLIADMDTAILAMLPHLQGVVFAYAQSDEISILLTDFEKETTSAWFDGNIQKMSSVAASIMTAHFNQARYERHFENEATFDNFKLAYFDCRVFTIPDRVEVMNYFRWRQQDCIRNSVSMVAQSNFSHKELQNKSQSDMHEMLHKKGINWATDFTDGEKNGRIFTKSFEESVCVPVTDKEIKELGLTYSLNTRIVKRQRWMSQGAWVFTKDQGKLLNMVPKHE